MKPLNLPKLIVNFITLAFAFLPAVFLSASNSPASPMPGMGSSVLVSPEKGFFFASKGFTLAAPSTWKFEKSPENREGLTEQDEFAVIYSYPTIPTLRLSLKTDSLKTNMTVEAYAKKWMKDYTSYGFDVLGAKTFTSNQTKGLVVDLLQRKQGTQLRQVIFVKNKTAVTLTCLDQQKTFNAHIQTCNEIVRTFSWNQTMTNDSKSNVQKK